MYDHDRIPVTSTRNSMLCLLPIWQYNINFTVFPAAVKNAQSWARSVSHIVFHICCQQHHHRSPPLPVQTVGEISVADFMC